MLLLSHSDLQHSRGNVIPAKFYRRHYELIKKFHVGLKYILHQGLSEPEFYCDLVYKFKKIMGRTDFLISFENGLNVMRQSACLVINPITVDNFAALFNCTPVDRASDSMMARPKAIHFSWFGPELFRLLHGPPGLNC